MALPSRWFLFLLILCTSSVFTAPSPSTVSSRPVPDGLTSRDHTQFARNVSLNALQPRVNRLNMLPLTLTAFEAITPISYAVPHLHALYQDVQEYALGQWIVNPAKPKIDLQWGPFLISFVGEGGPVEWDAIIDFCKYMMEQTWIGGMTGTYVAL